MASNTFGSIFKMTTWGESHGKAIGVVIDGCPAGLELSEQDINLALKARAPGANSYVSPRKEPDLAEIYSGVFEGKTTGAPISIIIENKNHDSSKYESIKNLLRPGHANATYLHKYGIFDHRGGGRASARETACRVAAGAVASKILDFYNIQIISYIKSIGPIVTPDLEQTFEDLKHTISQSAVNCPDEQTSNKMMQTINDAKQQGDSLGGVVELKAFNLPVGLGDPVYEKLEAKLANAMMSLPATKGFEIGEGFQAAFMKGSGHNDSFISKTATQTNHAGGTLGGISTGMPLVVRVAFKPTSSIMLTQATVDTDGNNQNFNLPEGSRHDPCVAIRAVPIVSAMCSIVLADCLLMNLAARLAT